ncbi:MAG: aminotransferase class V-fold PLP-dependent enzyme [Cyclobacteriaceae bacterium]|nr:aminotransferase class V-fold PLP-dependent enzyme [Cyclobacteriaceae bacterium]
MSSVMTEMQKRMFAEMHDKTIFNKALQHGFEYIDHAFERNVYPTDHALQNLSHFEEPMPAEPTHASALLNSLHEYGSPATVTHVGGRYFGFVTGSVVPAAMSAKVLGTFWDQVTAMYVLSPVSAKLETVVESWLKSVFNLPGNAVAGFVSGSSMANLCGLAAARYRLLKNQGWDVNQQGLMSAPPIRVITGKEAHSTVLKSISILGFGQASIQFIDTDDQGRIKTDLVPELDNRTLLILQAGNVNSGSFDDFATLCEKAQQAGAWVHIDGAFGLWAAAVKQLAHLTKGIEMANSWAVDGHKTLNTPYDCGIVMCSDKEALTGALHMSGGYIVVSKDRDGMFYTPEMSRRSRVIELWATMKYLGKTGIDQMVLSMHERARQFAMELSVIDGFTVLNDVVFNQVVVACKDDDTTVKVMEAIQQERVCWVGGSTWRGKRVIRISVCSWATTEEDVTQSVASFRNSLEKVKGK